jgi:site-specific DNA-cytosine methylase
VGIDGACHALSALGVDFHAIHVYDIREHLRRPLTELHGPERASQFKLGDIEGDILNVNEREWERVDGVVSGPPCPPWSTIGQRARHSDPREAVFRKVTDILVDQAFKGCFFFIVEMVPGIRHKQQGQPHSYYEEWLQELRGRAPQWHIQCWSLNSSTFGLPQDRERVYTIGVNLQTVGIPATPPLDKLCRAPLRTTTLAQFLHPRMPKVWESRLNPNMAANLRAYKKIIEPELLTGTLGSFACISLDRCPSKDFGKWVRVDGMVDTFRTCNEHLWLLSLGEGPAGPSISRPLHPVERLGMQGFPSWVARHLSKRQLLEATGNSFSVPVVGCVLVQLLNTVGTTGAWTTTVPRSVATPEPLPCTVSTGGNGPATGDIDSATEAQLRGLEQETQELLNSAAEWRQKTARLRDLRRDSAGSGERTRGLVSATT